jgi:lipoate-protein ligase A
MDTWRVLPLSTHDAFMNMAIDEAILESRVQEKVRNTLRFYRWKPSAVSIGRFQSIDREVNLDACKQHGIDVVRRISGGGTVYHDFSRELTYSIVVDCENAKITEDVLTSYNGVCSGLLRGLALLGVRVELDNTDPSQRCPNIMIDGKKVSGNAQARRGGILLQHGTILMDLDVPTMLSVLKNPRIVMNKTVVEFVLSRITTLSKELKREVSFEEVEDSLRKGFQEAFDVELVEDCLTEAEIGMAEELRKTRYLSDNWNYISPQLTDQVSCLAPRDLQRS